MFRNNMGVESKLMPTRFVLTMAHFIAVMMIFSTKDDNILASLPSSFTADQLETQETELSIALWLSVGCFAVEFLGLLSGFSLFRAKHNVFCT